MKAARLTQYGGPEVVTTTSNAPKPEISNSQVLVEVYAAGVNPFDWKVREGMMRQMAELTFPAVLGGDLAGIVTEVGAYVTHLKPGDAVYGQAGALSSHGSFAEFAPAAGASLSLKPENIDFVQAAALPLAGVSVIQAVVETLELKSGQNILIHGGAGGIGSIAIELAKHIGAYVATTAAADQADFLKKLGADEVIDYKIDTFENKLSGYDAVLDTIGGSVYTNSFKILKPGGAIVSMNAAVDEILAKQYKVTAHMQFTQVTSDRLIKLAALVAQRVITVNVYKVFLLDEAAEALAYLQHGTPRGKVVIRVRD